MYSRSAASPPGVPAAIAAELERFTPEQFRELLEDFADAGAAREALAEIEAGARPVPAAQVWAELGLDGERDLEAGG